MNKILVCLLFLLLIATLVLSTGCATTGNTQGGATFKVRLQAAPNINPDVYGKNSPIAITVYQLTSPEEFANVSYDKLNSSPLTSVVDSKTWIIWPGQTEQQQFTLWPQTKYLGVTASYRDLNGKTWKFTKSIGWFTSSISIQINATGIKEK